MDCTSTVESGGGSNVSPDLRLYTLSEIDRLAANSCDEGGSSNDEFLADYTSWLPMCDNEKKPYVNQCFNDIDCAFGFYKQYGKACGFDVKRSAQKINKDGNVSTKYFLCSNSGFSDSFRSRDKMAVSVNSELDINNEEVSTLVGSVSGRKKRRGTSSRCGCNAKVTIKYVSAGVFRISDFVEEHNHKLASDSCKQFLRCSRELSDVQKRFIINVAEMNIGATRAHSIMKTMTGSFESIGATVVDFKNFQRDVRLYIGKHDADMMIQKFKDKAETSNNYFKFEYETDSEGHLIRIFWADAVGRRDYKIYGDCVSFDATYRTNKYRMIFVPFIGIDNHWKSVTFAAALLEKEDVENFSWLCKVFQKIMGKPPKCIITDQCPAMRAAIRDCFPPEVKHRFCMWHIMKKFPSKLGSLFCCESEFIKKLNRVVWGDHLSPDEFEAGWNAVVKEFGLSDNVWLTEMFDLRSFWIPAFFKDDHMAGLLRTTSRSESSNFFFSHFLENGDTLSEFYMCYESALEKQRHSNGLLNKDDSVVPIFLTTKGIERHAAHIYTLSLFYKVQADIKAGCFDIVIDNVAVMPCMKKFCIRDMSMNSSSFEVDFWFETQDIHCSCEMYNRVGYLCKHCFFCLGVSGINKIPAQFVKNRWMKRAEERYLTLNLGDISDKCIKQTRMRSKRSEAWFEFQSCITDAGGDEDVVDVVLQGVKELRGKIREKCGKVSARLDDRIIEELVGSKPCAEISVLPPRKSNNKGCRKRMASAIEISVAGHKRKERECKTCHVRGLHDSRNCPSKDASKDKETAGGDEQVDDLMPDA